MRRKNSTGVIFSGVFLVGIVVFCAFGAIKTAHATKPPPPPKLTIQQKVEIAETIFRGRIVGREYYLNDKLVNPETINTPERIYVSVAIVEVMDRFVGITLTKKFVRYPLGQFKKGPKYEAEEEKMEGKDFVFWGRVNVYKANGEERMEIIPRAGYGPESTASIGEYMKFIADKYGASGPSLTIIPHSEYRKVPESN